MLIAQPQTLYTTPYFTDSPFKKIFFGGASCQRTYTTASHPSLLKMIKKLTQEKYTVQGCGTNGVCAEIRKSAQQQATVAVAEESEMVFKGILIHGFPPIAYDCGNQQQ